MNVNATVSLSADPAAKTSRQGSSNSKLAITAAVQWRCSPKSLYIQREGRRSNPNSMWTFNTSVNLTKLSLDTVRDLHSFQMFRPHSNPLCMSPVWAQSRTVSLFSGLTSIMPLSRDWQSGGMKWGMWNTPLFTFSRSWRKLSWSNGRAPCSREKERGEKEKGRKNRCDVIK